jgi:hypothetical protein
MKNIPLIVSVLLNIVLIAKYCFMVEPKEENAFSNSINKHLDYEITSMNNFEEVYFSRNDSLYNELWGEAFENEPQRAFLISCSYFYVTKDKRILKDIELSAEQMEDVYQRKFKIDSGKVNK